MQKLQANPNALGIFGFSFLDQNSDVVQGSKVNGEDPTFENIADGAYPVSRPLYFYAKKAHIGTIPGIAEYLAEFTSEGAMGEDGYLADRGLIPLPADEYTVVVARRREPDKSAACSRVINACRSFCRESGLARRSVFRTAAFFNF